MDTCDNVRIDGGGHGKTVAGKAMTTHHPTASTLSKKGTKMYGFRPGPQSPDNYNFKRKNRSISDSAAVRWICNSHSRNKVNAPDSTSADVVWSVNVLYAISTLWLVFL